MKRGRFRVVIYVQHLLGTGHLVRMSMLANGLADRGATVTLISGGQPVPGLSHGDCRLVQLRPVQTSAGDFSTLLDSTGLEIDDAFRSRRCADLTAAVDEARPDALIIETWPFGRRQLEFELIPLLEHLFEGASRPVVISSIRDILQRRTEKRRSQSLEQLARYFSAVIVHGDAAITPLNESFAEADRIPCPVYYGGYLYRSHPAGPESARSGTRQEILVSAGGGAAGRRLLACALDTALIDERPWRILVGSRPSSSDLQAFRERVGIGNDDSPDTRIQIEPNRTDFFRLLKGCLASVSQCGYNTALDLVHAGCPAVVVPYAEGGETEQETRARLFAERGWMEPLSEEMLCSSTLRRAINNVIERAALTREKRSNVSPAMDEANIAAGIVENILEDYRSQ